MLRKTIKYQNAFGEEKEKVALFSLSQEDLIRLNKKYGNELGDVQTEVQAAQDGEVNFDIDTVIKSMDVIIDFVRTAYYETDAEGEAFIRTPEVKEKFLNSFAGAALIDELMVDEKAAQEFMRGVVSHIKNDKLQEALSSTGVIS